MKKILIILISISQFFSFAQNDKNNHNNLHLKIFNPVIEINNNEKTPDYLVFEDILKSIHIAPTNNSEGKFAIYDTYQKELLEAQYTLSIDNRKTVKKEIIKSSKKATSIVIESYTQFINEIITEAYIKESKNYKISLEQIEKTNKNNYLDYHVLVKQDKLNKKIEIDDNINIEIGQNIYKYINKIYKSELDKTLRNSINLLVVNW